MLVHKWGTIVTNNDAVLCSRALCRLRRNKPKIIIKFTLTDGHKWGTIVTNNDAVLCSRALCRLRRNKSKRIIKFTLTDGHFCGQVGGVEGVEDQYYHFLSDHTAMINNGISKCFIYSEQVMVIFSTQNVAMETDFPLFLTLSGYYSRTNPVVYYGIVISMFRFYVLQSLKNSRKGLRANLNFRKFSAGNRHQPP